MWGLDFTFLTVFQLIPVQTHLKQKVGRKVHGQVGRGGHGHTGTLRLAPENQLRAKGVGQN